VLNFLGASWRSGRRWSQVVLDPPSRSVSSAVIGGFDIQRDHRELVLATLEVMQPGGVLWFSTNHQRFEPELEMLPVAERQEVTAATIPPDFRNGQVHRCWRMVTPG
jgi:23S rRNA (cytosine1962-C5)-methyltransferase